MVANILERNPSSDASTTGLHTIDSEARSAEVAQSSVNKKESKMSFFYIGLFVIGLFTLFALNIDDMEPFFALIEEAAPNEDDVIFFFTDFVSSVIEP